MESECLPALPVVLVLVLEGLCTVQVLRVQSKKRVRFNAFVCLTYIFAFVLDTLTLGKFLF